MLAQIGDPDWIETAPNRGVGIDKALRLCHLEPDQGPPGGFAWCASDIVWCCNSAGVILPRIAGVHRLAAAIELRRIAEFEPGCIGLHFESATTGHATFVVAANEDGTLSTVSGNTNSNGSREGTLVGMHDKPREWFSGGFFHTDKNPVRA